jgi:hypothetical protein
MFERTSSMARADISSATIEGMLYIHMCGDGSSGRVYLQRSVTSADFRAQKQVLFLLLFFTTTKKMLAEEKLVTIVGNIPAYV